MRSTATRVPEIVDVVAERTPPAALTALAPGLQSMRVISSRKTGFEIECTNHCGLSVRFKVRCVAAGLAIELGRYAERLLEYAWLLGLDSIDELQQSPLNDVRDRLSQFAETIYGLIQTLE